MRKKDLYRSSEDELDIFITNSSLEPIMPFFLSVFFFAALTQLINFIIFPKIFIFIINLTYLHFYFSYNLIILLFDTFSYEIVFLQFILFFFFFL
jgi:hypothetical protein